VQRFSERWRLTLLGVPLLVATAFVVEGISAYPFVVFVLATPFLGWLDTLIDRHRRSRGE
jgi:hypothetical protein